MTISTTEKTPRAVLVAVQLPTVSDAQHEADVAELGRLVKTLGLDVIGRVTQRRGSVSPATVLGEGKLRELARWTGGDGHTDPTIASRDKALERRERMGLRDDRVLEGDDDLEGDDGPEAPSADDPDDAASSGLRPSRSRSTKATRSWSGRASIAAYRALTRCLRP